MKFPFSQHLDPQASTLGKRARAAFSLLELIMVVAVIGLLFVCIWSLTGLVRSQAQAVHCQSVQHGIGLAVEAFTADHDGFIPAPIVDWGQRRWNDQLAGYLDQPELAPTPLRWRCPGWANSAYRNYWAERTDGGYPATWDTSYGVAVAVIENNAWQLSGVNWNSFANEASILRARISHPSTRTYLADSGPWWLWPQWLVSDGRYFNGDFARH